LAPLLAGLSPNTQAVDCNLLLDRELERKTETGIMMNNMLARGQVVPLSTTLELLKDIANLSCSESLVLENCPMYVDQVDYIQKEFRIDRVFYISGDSAANQAWKDAYVKANKSEDPSRDMKAFDERMERLEPIVTYFSRLGKLERIEVSETPTKEALANMVESVLLPKFLVVSGLSTVLTPKVANQLATDYGVGPALTKESVIEFAATKLKMTVDPADHAQFNAALKQYALSGSYSMLVLDRYPKTAAEASAFVEFFGEPTAMANILCDEEFIDAEYQEAHADEEGGDGGEEDVAEK
jgi:adenylate kinase family enzyme